MTTGDRIRIIPEQEFRIMSPPRRPRGEKPATTMRIQARQIKELQQIIDGYRRALDDKSKVIAGFDVQISEAEDEIKRLQFRGEHQAVEVATARRTMHLQSERVAFLEGYYAKSQEEAARAAALRPAGSLVPGNPAQAHTGRRPANPGDLQGGRPGGPQVGEAGPAGFEEGFGREVWSQRPHHQAHPSQRPMEHPEITTEGLQWTEADRARWMKP